MTYTDGYPMWTDDDPDLAMPHPAPSFRDVAIDVEARDVTNFLPPPAAEECVAPVERVGFSRAAFVRAAAGVALLLCAVGAMEAPRVVSTGRPDVVVARSVP